MGSSVYLLRLTSIIRSLTGCSVDDDCCGGGGEGDGKCAGGGTGGDD